MNDRLMADDIISAETIKKDLRTACFGQDIRYFTSTASTNLVAKELAQQGVREGTLVIADYQTRGKGRLTRTWWSPRGENLLFSLIFRPACEVALSFRLTLLTSLAVAAAIRQEAGVEALIKWPNDVYIKGKKVAGILSELGMEGEVLHYVIVGTGINVNSDPSMHPELKTLATSLRVELGRNFSRVKLLKVILELVEHYYQMLKRGEVGLLRESWDRLSLVKGKRVKVVSMGSSEEGIAESIDDEGFLILRDFSGNEHRIISADVSLIFT